MTGQLQSVGRLVQSDAAHTQHAQSGDAVNTVPRGRAELVVMLDSQADTDDVVDARRRCRSWDALRDAVDIPVWFADDASDYGPARRPPVAVAGGDEAAGRCLSASDLLAAGAGDDYDPSWCSVNNLETDCVSPRVSSNSLFSALDAGTAASSDDVGDRDPSHRLTAADLAAAADRRTPADDPPMYTRLPRRAQPLQAPAAGAGASRGPITAFLLRQLTNAAAGDAPARPPAFGRAAGGRRSSLAAAARSASCPSLVDDHRHQAAEPMQTQPVAEPGVDVGGEDEEVEQARREQQVRAVMAEALAPASIIAHTTGCGARSPMVWLTARPGRSTSPPTSSSAQTDTWDCPAGRRRPVDDGGRKARHSGVGSGSSAMTAGRATQRLARTKCIQWLNSFDEDD